MDRSTAACCAALLLFAFCPGAPADEGSDDTPVEGRIVGKVWHARHELSDGMAFLHSVRSALELDQSAVPMVMMMPPGMGRLSSPVLSVRGERSSENSTDIKGTLLFLQTRPETRFESSIRFEYVGSLKDYQRRIAALAKQFGARASVIGEDDRHEIRLAIGQVILDTAAAGPPGSGQTDADDEPPVRAFSIMIRAESDSEAPADGEGSTATPPPVLKSISSWYRYVDGIMYSSNAEIIHTAQLPGTEELTRDDSEPFHDICADFDLREIPLELKRAFWNAVEASAGTWLQRFDNEQLGDYSLRKVLGESRLELIRAGLFDVERVRLSVQMPQPESPNLRAKLRVTARESSRLAETLAELSRQPTRLQGLPSEDSPLVIASTVRLPEWAAPAGTAVVDSLRLRLRQSAGDDDALRVLVDDLFGPLETAARDRLFDAAVSLDGNPTTGLCLRAGIRLPNAEQFLTSLRTLVSVLPDSGITASQIDVEGVSGLMLSPTEPFDAGGGLRIPGRLCLAATGSWLWLTLGGESGLPELRELVRSSETRLSQLSAGTPFRLRMRLSRWLADTDDEFSRVPAEALTIVERWLADVTRPRMVFSMQVNGKPVTVGNPDEAAFARYAPKLLTPESSDLEITTRTTSRELTVTATVGLGVLRLAAAQYAAAQANLFRNVPIHFTPAGGGGSTRTIRIQGANP